MLCTKVQNFKMHPAPTDDLRMLFYVIQSIFLVYVLLLLFNAKCTHGSCGILFLPIFVLRDVRILFFSFSFFSPSS